MQIDCRVETGQFLCVLLKFFDVCAEEFLPFFRPTHLGNKILDSVDLGAFLIVSFGVGGF